jgi:hypothetical protein
LNQQKEKIREDKRREEKIREEKRNWKTQTLA